ncbi:MAG: hypothetical protein ACI8U3_002475 [Brevundimonas sp.]|jgi:hypothetical protein|uniref:hypothetical protein n=1 Tax=Brevundimonas sp. TaxID=1871086 RepID=UPI0039E480C9
MRTISFLAAAGVAAALAGAASAQPEVTVTIGDRLDREASRELGQAEVADQARALEARLERELASNPAYDGARINLVLTDVAPNRPTRQQLSDTPGLDYIRSFSVGGAAIEGEVITADGQTRPVQHDWYSHDIRDSRYMSTWQDADRAFMRFSRRLAQGRL